MRNIIKTLVTASLFVPALAFAQVSNITFPTQTNYLTNNSVQLNLTISNYTVTTAANASFSIDNASLADIGTVQVLNQKTWVTVPMAQTTDGISGLFSGNIGTVSGSTRQVSIKLTFKTPKNYLLGYTLKSVTGNVLASNSLPIKVTGKVLGAVTYNFTHRLSVGSSGADVTALQNKLTAEGFYSGPITGYFGSQTKAAVAAYQTAHGIQALGSVGPATLAALNK